MNDKLIELVRAEEELFSRNIDLEALKCFLLDHC
jgi:hypothetical protein